MSAAPVVPGLAVPRHVGIVTSDLPAAMRSLDEALGLTWNEPTASTQRVRHAGEVHVWPLRIAHSAAGPMRVELLQGPPGSPWHSAAAAELHHYAYTTDDLGAECRALAADGWEVELAGLGDDDDEVHGYAYLVRPRRPRIELIQR